jgi:hypothetical protein
MMRTLFGSLQAHRLPHAWLVLLMPQHKSILQHVPAWCLFSVVTEQDTDM